MRGSCFHRLMQLIFLAIQLVSSLNMAGISLADWQVWRAFPSLRSQRTQPCKCNRLLPVPANKMLSLRTIPAYYIDYIKRKMSEDTEDARLV